MDIIFAILCGALALFLFRSVKHGTASIGRSDFIETYRFPDKIRMAVLEQHSELNKADADRVVKGLREYFHVCNDGGKEFISMPSKVVDTAWHEFILFTREYQAFCEKAFGRFLHHTPAEDMRQPKGVQKGIRAAWRLSCSRENINDRSPAKLPLLFALDATLGIENGYAYELDCANSMDTNSKVSYCVSYLSNNSDGGCGGDGGSSSEASPEGGSAGASCGSGCGGCGG